jgi:hypothetical protein
VQITHFRGLTTKLRHFEITALGMIEPPSRFLDEYAFLQRCYCFIEKPIFTLFNENMWIAMTSLRNELKAKTPPRSFPAGRTVWGGIFLSVPLIFPCEVVYSCQQIHPKRTTICRIRKTKPGSI